ncbi:hypothetical protein GCM10009558_045700 [Virgisporangium aurantiacum]
MTPDEDVLRQMFQEVQVPAGVDRWPARVPRPVPRRTRSRRFTPVLVGLLIAGVLLATAVIASPYRPHTTLGGATAPDAPAGATVSTAPAPSSPTLNSTSPPATPATPPTSPPGGWPSETTTGVPAGTALGTHTGDLRVDKAGQVVSDLLVTGTVTVTAPNVTIRRTRIVASGQFTVRQLPGATDLVIEDSEVSGAKGANVQYGIVQGASGLEVRRSHVHGVQQGIEAASKATITDSLIDGLVRSDSTTGVAARGGTGLTIRHSVVVNPTAGGTAVAVYADNGPQHTVIIDTSLLGGGQYTLHVGAGVTDITVSGNRFTRSATAGPIRWDAAPPGNRWSGNAWNDNGARLGPPA